MNTKAHFSYFTNEGGIVLEEMKKNYYDYPNLEDLKELTEIHLNSNEPIEQRINHFFEEVENPYCFKINGTIFKIKFSNNDKTLDNSIKSYISNLIELKD